VAKGGEAFLLDGRELALGDYVGALPVVFAVESDEDFASAETAESLGGIAGLARDAHPEDVDGGAEVDDFEAGFLADDGAAAVGADGESGAEFLFAIFNFRADACNAIIFDDEIGDFSFHEQVELRIGASFFGDEIEEVPLGHEADEFAVDRQVRKIGDGDGEIVDDCADFAELLVRDAEEIIEEAEFVDELEGGGVNGVPAEVAEEVGVFFEDEDLDACASEEEAEDHACGAAAGDEAGGWGGVGRHGRQFAIDLGEERTRLRIRQLELFTYFVGVVQTAREAPRQIEERFLRFAARLLCSSKGEEDASHRSGWRL
jgi:hypothetical protein